MDLCSAVVALDSAFGLRISFGLRSSEFGFGKDRPDFRAALGLTGTPCLSDSRKRSLGHLELREFQDSDCIVLRVAESYWFCSN
jgi:hypothetical protein